MTSQNDEQVKHINIFVKDVEKWWSVSCLSRIVNETCRSQHTQFSTIETSAPKVPSVQPVQTSPAL